MRIVIHVSKFYDWALVPAGVEVTQKDIDGGKVKPSNVLDAAGKPLWQMQVTKTADTHTAISVPEGQVIAQIIKYAIREREILTRKEAIAKQLKNDVMPECAHRSWMHLVEVEGDQGPDLDLLREMIAPHVASGKIKELDVPEIEAAYLTPETHDDHAEHLHKTFKIKPKPKPETAKEDEAAK